MGWETQYTIKTLEDRLCITSNNHVRLQSLDHAVVVGVLLVLLLLLAGEEVVGWRVQLLDG